MENKDSQMKITIDASDLTTCTKAAQTLGVQRSSVYRMIDRKVLRGHPIGGQMFVSVEEVNRLKEERDQKKVNPNFSVCHVRK
jgi:excisionase family DNA binding protein